MKDQPINKSILSRAAISMLLVGSPSLILAAEPITQAPLAAPATAPAAAPN